MYFKWLIGAPLIDLNEIKEVFEAIPNVRVVKLFFDDIDLDWAGAIIVIDDDKLLIFRNFRIEDFSKDSTKSIEIDRIGNYRLSEYLYIGEDKKGITRNGLYIGKNSSNNKLLNLGDINGIENIIKNYDLILSRVEQLPDDDCSLSNPHNNYGFWKPSDPESKSNLLHFIFEDGTESKIGKIKFEEIIDYTILDENIDMRDLLRFN
jgi:hypothetical protein